MMCVPGCVGGSVLSPAGPSQRNNVMALRDEDSVKHVLHVIIISSMLMENTFSHQIIPAVTTVQPDPDVVFLLNAIVKLPCQASGFPAPSYYWTKDNLRLDTNTDTKYVLDNGQLTIHNTTKSDEGVYYCWAENKGGIDRSEPITLTLAFLDPFPFKEPEVRRIELGTSVILECNPPPSYPSPELMWYKKDESDNMRPVTMNDGIIQDTEGNLHFVSFIRDYGGVYICVCFNRILRNQVHDHVIQLYPEGDSSVTNAVSLEWSSESPVTELTGNTLKIQCIFGAYPLPLVSWERLDANLPAGRHEIIKQGTALLIKDLQPEDSGTYECMAFNEFSVQPVRKEITVIVEAMPVLVKKPISVNITEGQDASFECGARGEPHPIITWYFNWNKTSDCQSPTYIANSEQIDNIVYSTLQVIKASLKDTIVISCVASNQHGQTQSSAYLSITEIIPVVGSDTVKIIPKYEFTLFTLFFILYVIHL